MDLTKIDLTTLLNLVLSLTILVLGFKRFYQSKVKAFAFIGLGFLMFGISHFSLIMGWTTFKSALAVIRAAGYVLVIVGLAI